MSKKVLRLLGVIFFIIPLFLLAINIKGYTEVSINESYSFTNESYSSSLFINIPVLEEEESFSIGYLTNGTYDNTTYHDYYIYRGLNTTGPSGATVINYYLRFYVEGTLIRSIPFDYNSISALLLNIDFVVSGLDSSVSVRYSIARLSSTLDIQYPTIKLVLDSYLTYTDNNYSPAFSNLMLYYNPNISMLSVFNGLTGATSIHNSLNDIIGDWELKLLNYKNIGKNVYNYAYDNGYKKATDDLTNDGAVGFWSNFLKIFSAIGSILSIQIIPGFPLGLFILLPLAFAIIGLILWVWRN